MKKLLARFDDDVVELSRLREATAPAYLTRRRNPHSLTLVQDREKAEKTRILEQLTQAGVAGSKAVRVQLPAAAAAALSHTEELQGSEGKGEEEGEDDDGGEAALVSVLYRQAESGGQTAMGRLSKPSSSSTRFLCSSSYLLLTSSYLASLVVEWRVGSFFKQTVRVQAGGRGALQGRIGRILDIVPEEDASRRGMAHSLHRCLRVLWYRAEDVEVEQERQRDMGGASQTLPAKAEVYRCHAIDLVSVQTNHSQPYCLARFALLSDLLPLCVSLSVPA